MATKEEQKGQIRDQWSASAGAWEKHDVWLEAMLGAVSRRMVDAVGAGPGVRILDLACGSGEPSMSAAARGAQVTATDLSPKMVEATARRAAKAGVALETRVMDIEKIEFPDASFDALTCRFGLMFCPDLPKAASELHRVLKPGGRFAVAVWSEPAKNPFFTALGQIVQEFGLAPPPDPAAPGVFRLGAPGELEAVLRAGGFTSVQTTGMPIVFTYASPEEYWDIQSQLAAPIKAAFANLPPGELGRLRAAVREVAIANTVDGQVRFPAELLIATGSR